MNPRPSRRSPNVVVAAIAVALSATGLVATASSAEAATLCQTDCIGAVTVTTGPEAARIQFDTAANTHTTIQVSGVGGAAPVKNYGQQDGEPWSNHYDITATGLPMQATAYQYVITSTDYYGSSWQKTGFFATKVRDINVDFGALVITDDSDNLGPGEIVGGAQIGTVPCVGGVKPLDPLSLTSTTSLSTGDTRTIGSGANLSCTKAPATVSVQSVLSDDDEDPGDDCNGVLFGWYTGASWDAAQGSLPCREFNNAMVDVSSPLAADSGGSGTKSFTMTADPTMAGGYSADLEWTLSGVATFSQYAVPVSLPSPISGQVDLHLTGGAGNGSVFASWIAPTQSAMTLSGYRLQWRPAGGSWLSMDVAAAVTFKSIEGLTNGQPYEFRVYALDATKLTWALDVASATPVAPPAATVIAGWSTATTTLPYGQSFVRNVTVTNGGKARTLWLEYLAPGASAWALHTTVPTTADGKAAITVPVKAGVGMWRVTAPKTATHLAATSAEAKVVSQSVITGFVTTSATVAAGTAINDGIKITPGANRVMKVQYQYAGTATWKTFQYVTANANGDATVTLSAKKGTTAWRVWAASTVGHGTGAVTALRTIKGL